MYDSRQVKEFGIVGMHTKPPTFLARCLARHSKVEDEKRIKHNEEIRQLCKDPDLAREVRGHRLAKQDTYLENNKT